MCLAHAAPVALAAAALHAGELTLASVVDAVSIDASLAGLLVLAGVAVAGGLVSPRALGPRDRTSAMLAVAVTWLALGLTQHYLLGLTPTWGGRPIGGLGHFAWDVAFHLPPGLLATLAVRQTSRRH